MSPKSWGFISIVFIGFVALAMERVERDEFDPKSLPPPSAGTAAMTTQPQLTCEGMIYSISEDGIKYVRESGGGILLAAEIDNKIGFYNFGKYGNVENVDYAGIDSEVSKKLKHALRNCSARHTLSGVNFSLR